MERRSLSFHIIRKSSDSRFFDNEDLKKVSQIVDIEAETFQFSSGISTLEAQEKLELYGLNKLPEKYSPKWLIFLQQVVQNMYFKELLNSLSKFLFS